MKQEILPYSSAQLLYYAWQLSRNRGGADDDKLTGVLSEARVDLNPHQVMAALFAFQSPFSKGVILADMTSKQKNKEKKKLLNRSENALQTMTLEKELNALTRQQKRKRMEIFDLEDEIESKRDGMIDKVKAFIAQHIREQPLFRVHWQLKR